MGTESLSIAARMAWLLASLARVNSSRVLTMITRFCFTRPSAFSIAASPAPTTTIVSSLYSSGSSSWYWTKGRSSPGRPSLRRLPCMPMASTTLSAATLSPLARVSSNSPRLPEIPVTEALKRVLTPWRSASAYHCSRMLSRVPASKSTGARSGSTMGSAMTCLPFW